MTVLSGSRQGQVLAFDKDEVTIGEQDQDDIRFSAADDAGARGRRLLVEKLADCWRAKNLGVLPIFVNEKPVTGTTELHSGDFLRLSVDGPDLCFEVFSDGSDTNALSPTLSPELPSATNDAGAAKVGEQIAAPTSNVSSLASQSVGSRRDADVKSSQKERRLPSSIRHFAVVAAFFVLAFLLLFFLLPKSWFSPTAAETDTAQIDTGPVFNPVGVLVAEEGEHFFWRPTLKTRHVADRFSLVGDVPEAMTIDERTGTIRWPTGEDDGPGEYQCNIVVDRMIENRRYSDSLVLEIRVEEVNRPPSVSSLPRQEIDLLETPIFNQTIEAEDGDLPPQSLTYRLGPGAPRDAEVDPETGEIKWKVGPGYADQVVKIPFVVSDNAAEPAETAGRIAVQVRRADPWAIAEEKISSCSYLLIAITDPGRIVIPLGTVCAVDRNKLLTSASVAQGVAEARSLEWQVLATKTDDLNIANPTGWPITNAESHAVYVRASESKEERERILQQAYFDLAILTTDKELPVHADLADVAKSAANGDTVACFGYEIAKDSLTRFDHIEPLFEQIELLEIIPPPNETRAAGRPPLLLQLMGQLPLQPFGATIINKQGQVLGVYAFQGKLPPGVTSEPVHYAPDVLPIQAYLDGRGRRWWIESQPDPTNARSDR